METPLPCNPVLGTGMRVSDLAGKRKAKAPNDRSGKADVPSEDWEQMQLVQWARQYPEFQYLFHIANESTGGYGWRSRLSKMGCKNGVPDLFYPVPIGGRHGLFIEMKRKGGGVVSAAQRRWIDVLTSFGYGAVVCRGWEEARDALLDYTGRSAAREATENGNMDN